MKALALLLLAGSLVAGCGSPGSPGVETQNAADARQKVKAASGGAPPGMPPR